VSFSNRAAAPHRIAFLISVLRRAGRAAVRSAPQRHGTTQRLLNDAAAGNAWPGRARGIRCASTAVLAHPIPDRDAQVNASLTMTRLPDRTRRPHRPGPPFDLGDQEIPASPASGYRLPVRLIRLTPPRRGVRRGSWPGEQAATRSSDTPLSRRAAR
jgi:hypothetical protein